MPLSSLQRNLATRLMNKAFAKMKRDAGYIEALRERYQAYLKDFASKENLRVGEAMQSEKLARLAFEKILDSPIEFELRSWPWTILRQVGKCLYDLLLDATRFDVRLFDSANETEKSNPTAMSHYQHAFFIVFRQHGPEVHCEVKTHPALVRAFDIAQSRALRFEATELPMLVPPVPWISAHTGGYLLANLRLIRSSDAQWLDTLSLFKQHAGPDDCSRRVTRTCLEPSLDALNTLGSVPWKINKRILQHVTDVFRKKGDRSLSIPVTESCFPSPARTKRLVRQFFGEIHPFFLFTFRPQKEARFGEIASVLYMQCRV